MRPNHQNRRIRGRNRKGPNPLSRSYESNGPDVKVRGTAQHVAEKYVQLARDAQSAGDTIMAENYLQHGEHYFRLVAAAYAQQQQAFSGQRSADDSDDDYDGEEEQDRFAPYPNPNAPRQTAEDPAGFGPQPGVEGEAGGEAAERPPFENRRERFGERPPRFERPERQGGERQGGDRQNGDRPERGPRRERFPRQDRPNFQDRPNYPDRPGFQDRGNFQDRPAFQERPPFQDRPAFQDRQPPAQGADFRPVAAAPAGLEGAPQPFVSGMPGADEQPAAEGGRRERFPRRRFERGPRPPRDEAGEDAAGGLPAFLTNPVRTPAPIDAPAPAPVAPPAAPATPAPAVEAAGEEAPKPKRGRGRPRKVVVEPDGTAAE